MLVDPSTKLTALPTSSYIAKKDTSKFLDYNFLLGHTWTYAMNSIMSSIFRIILFPLDGKIVTVDKLSFCTPDYSPLPSSFVPLLGGVTDSYINIGTGLLKASSLMCCFPL